MLFSVALGTFLLMLPALDNGYPLILFGDTLAYTQRPLPVANFKSPLYYYFIHWLGGNRTLWLPIAFQSFLVSLLVVSLARTLWNCQSQRSYLYIFLLTLACSSLPVLCSTLHPDVFSVTLIGSCFYALTTKRKWVVYLMYVSYFLSLTSHYSHIIAALLATPALIYLGKKNLIEHTRVVWILGLTLTPIILFGVSRGADSRNLRVAETAIYYPMGALYETELLNKHLDEFCETENYILCHHRPEMKLGSPYFIYKENSIWNSPRANGYKREEIIRDFERIGGDIIRNQWRDILLLSVARSIEQLFRTDTLSHLQRAHVNNIHVQIEPTLIHAQSYLSSKQHLFNYRKPIYMNFILKFQKSLYMGFLFTLFIFLVFPRFRSQSANREGHILLIVVGTFLLSNAVACGVFSTVASRYQIRVAWYAVLLFPWLVWHMVPSKEVLQPQANLLSDR